MVLTREDQNMDMDGKVGVEARVERGVEAEHARGDVHLVRDEREDGEQADRRVRHRDPHLPPLEQLTRAH